MKSPVKALTVAGVLLIALPLLLWTGTFLYWHFRISAAIGWFESTVAKQPPEAPGSPGFRKASETIQSAGCRSLPYVMGAVDESKHPQFLTSMIALATWHADIPSTETRVGIGMERLQLQPGDSAELRREKIRLLRSWWREKGSEHHQWWRVWSGKCP